MSNQSIDFTRLFEQILKIREKVSSVNKELGGDNLTRELLLQLDNLEKELPEVKIVEENISAIQNQIIFPVREQLEAADRKLSIANDNISRADKSSRKLWYWGILIGVLVSLITNLASMPLAEQLYGKDIVSGPQIETARSQARTSSNPDEDLFQEGSIALVTAQEVDELRSLLVASVFQNDTKGRSRVITLATSKGIAKGLTVEQRVVLRTATLIATGSNLQAAKEIEASIRANHDGVDLYLLRTVAQLNAGVAKEALSAIPKLDGDSWLGVSEPTRRTLKRRVCTEALTTKAIAQESFDKIGVCLADMTVRFANGSGSLNKKKRALDTLKQVGFSNKNIETAELNVTWNSTHVFYSEKYSAVAEQIAARLGKYIVVQPKSKSTNDRVRGATQDLVIVLGKDPKDQ